MTRLPTIAQLRNLADRADRGRLTPAEVARLRAGISRLERPRTNRGASWSARVRDLRRKLRTLHSPMVRGGIQICTSCSGWNGVRCVGLVTEWPCETLDAFDTTFPAKDTAA